MIVASISFLLALGLAGCNDKQARSGVPARGFDLDQAANLVQVGMHHNRC